MNDYDSSRILDLLKVTYGLTEVTTPEHADLLLLNTCSIREKALEKVFSELGRWRHLKEKRPKIIIGVGGCVASQEGEDLRKRAPYVDLVFGPQSLHRLPNMLSTITKKRSPLVDISFPLNEKFDKLPDPIADGPSAYVSIMEGCNKYCSYCVVPYTRGEELSRPFDEVLHEVSSLTKQGVKEITLLGQNVNAYSGKMHDGKVADLALLIHYLDLIEPLHRIRFTTSHPVEFTERLVSTFATTQKLANHLHLPVQSGSDRILKLMKRGHTREEYKQKIANLRSVRPNISITSDFIVGFPSETEKDFQDTLDLVDGLEFDLSFSFIYSKRPGTPASTIPDDVSLETKKERLHLLQSKLADSALKFSQTMLNSIQTIICLGPSKKDPSIMFGRTDNNRIVNFIGKANIADKLNIKITEVKMHTLFGEVV